MLVLTSAGVGRSRSPWAVRPRNMTTLRKGQVVAISRTHHWAKGALGTVGQPPRAVRELAGDWQGCVRNVRTVQETMPYYWVNFDEPQLDADGDGPYAAGEI